MAKKRQVMKKADYEKELRHLQDELSIMLEWIINTNQKYVVIFEGRDAAGKGGVIKRITQYLNPRNARIAALPVPTEREKTQWYFQRYVNHLPASGELVLFDRSWYNRALVERVMGYCTEMEYEEFMVSCPEFEHMLIRSGIHVIKYWFSVSDDVQEERFKRRLEQPKRRWKLSPMDLASRMLWVEYSRAKDDMLARTHTTQSPWFVVDGDVKRHARLNCIHHLLSIIPYEWVDQRVVKLSLRPQNPEYERPPFESQNHIPTRYP
ncbi:MAG: polyphosphate kinase 2 [Gammaproteobacteria bacterium]|nr:polyphosphate kinase 2 [Gammaproteobacteria bacterium]MXW06625.1 polyphosphate kinase 2 [Gammaproteobacteria bacterium]MYC26153.1 polyphosphate kinase 2 [Gammaproteobacteria bacterium]